MIREKGLKKKKRNLILQQQYDTVNAIDSSIQELLYLVINIIMIKEAVREEIKFLNEADNK